MTNVDVNTAVLNQIATDLDSGATGLEGLAGSTPTGVDSGDMTGIVSAMLAQVVDSAGNVSTACTAAADLVRECRRYYLRDDADAEMTLEQIERVVKPGK